MRKPGEAVEELGQRLGRHATLLALARDVDLDALARRTDRFTGADLEDLVRRAGLFALRQDIGAKSVQAAHFDHALEETRASVTPEMEREYEQMAARLKQDALAIEPIGFISPGMLRPHGPKGID